MNLSLKQKEGFFLLLSAIQPSWWRFEAIPLRRGRVHPFGLGINRQELSTTWISFHIKLSFAIRLPPLNPELSGLSKNWRWAPESLIKYNPRSDLTLPWCNTPLDYCIEFLHKMYEIIRIITFPHTIRENNLQWDPVVKFCVCRRTKEKKTQRRETEQD